MKTIDPESLKETLCQIRTALWEISHFLEKLTQEKEELKKVLTDVVLNNINPQTLNALQKADILSALTNTQTAREIKNLIEEINPKGIKERKIPTYRPYWLIDDDDDDDNKDKKTIEITH